MFSNGISMEHTSDLVYEGKLVHEDSYPQRSAKYEEVEIEGVKVDYYDARNRVIHEIKKSNKVEKAHEWQLKYYIYVFERNGIVGVTGILEYPLMRKTSEVVLSDIDRVEITRMEKEIGDILNSEECPDLCQRRSICKKCSYGDFCFSGEDEE